MNYRHAYHAGNFADVLKHSVLALVIEHLLLKPAPFRVIDTHAGAGHYDLAGPEAEKTGEWRQGIGRLIGPDAAPLPAEVALILEPYFGALARCDARSQGAAMPARYPGSPAIALSMLRPGDALIANEFHPEERMRLARGLGQALDRFATGTYLLWHPIKDMKPVARIRRDLAGTAKALSIELLVRAPDDPERLNGCGLVVVNPPFTLEAKLATLLPFLAAALAQGPGATSWSERLGGSRR
jgi:23S rRNA (adenine2030-N6)-methyltransferase